MNRFFSFCVAFYFSVNIFSQELRCEVIVNSDLVNQTNQQIFSTLEKSIQEI